MHVQHCDKDEDNYVCNIESGSDDAKHIVKCVNEYNDLVEALEGANYVIDELTQNTPTEDSEYLEYFAQIHYILDKAKG